MKYVIICGGLVGQTRIGDSMVVPGSYLSEYDPEAQRGHGYASWTTDIALAMKFNSAEDAMNLWKTVPKSRPIRWDGKPNRPLTAFTIGVERIDTD